MAKKVLIGSLIVLLAIILVVIPVSAGYSGGNTGEQVYGQNVCTGINCHYSYAQGECTCDCICDGTGCMNCPDRNTAYHRHGCI